MAFYPLIYKIDAINKKIILPVIADDELYQQCYEGYSKTTDYNWNYSQGQFLQEAFNIFDEALLNKYPMWNVTTVYVDAYDVTESMKYYDRAGIKKLFPNFIPYQDLDPALNPETYQSTVSINGKVVPKVVYRNYLDSGQHYGIRDTGEATTAGYLFPFGGGYVSFLSNQQYYGIDIMVVPTKYIVDNKFDVNGDIRYGIVSLYAGGTPERDSYYSVIVIKKTVRVTVDSTIRKFWLDLDLNDMISDPFEPGGGSESAGGDGDFDNTSTPIEIPNLPSVSAASTGFISLFNPTLSQLNELASYMWSDFFDIDTLKKLFADPMDVILGLSILPVQIPTSGAREVKVGNIGTGISLNVASTQFVEVDCGIINVNEYWGAYLDYSPYTHAQIYLPYVGVRPISVDEIMGKSVNVKYHVDILTGACCCFVKCGDSVLYSFNGQCSIPIPISATNYTNTINGIINVAASLGTMVATGGATAPLAAASLASTITNQMKPTVEKSGAISGPGGVMAIQTPYLILTRPRQALPSKQNTFTGYPSFITATLGELTGYTEVHSIHLENIPATADELSEIETLLKGGVIF